MSPACEQHLEVTDYTHIIQNSAYPSERQVFHAKLNIQKSLVGIWQNKPLTNFSLLLNYIAWIEAAY